MGRRWIYPSTTTAKVGPHHVCCGETVGIRTGGIGVIETSTAATSVIPTVISTMAMTPSGRLDVTVRLKSNACQDRDQRGSCGPASPSQEKDSSENEGGRAHDGVSAWKDSNLRNA
jgi:hypothetical protein